MYGKLAIKHANLYTRPTKGGFDVTLLWRDQIARGGWTQLTFSANFDLLMRFFNSHSFLFYTFV